MSDNIRRLSILFEGFAGAYGTYDPTIGARNSAKGGKVEIKSSAKTVRAPVTVELWYAHVQGRSPLGIIPIREDETCVWGCIDVDKYDLDFAGLMKSIQKYELPLVICKSKSGGAHLFMFVSEAVTAYEMQHKLKEFAGILGLGNCEIFPKQTTILADKGDLGNWLNMPYFDGDKTSRYGMKENLLGMTLAEFVAYAEGKRVVDIDKITVQQHSNDDLADGPPCLQYLSTTGFPEGTRNNGLFALGVFCKKKFTNWQDKLEEFNREFMNPPLPADEVSAMIKNLEKKEYNYRCSDQPCVAHCNSTVCRTRKFGVGGSDEFPVLTGLSVLDTDPPLWFADVDGQRVELTTDQLQNYRAFHKVAMEKLHVCYMMLTQPTWLRMINQAMKDAILIEIGSEASQHGKFMELLEDFLIGRHRAEKKEDVLSGKPWEDEEHRRFYFRLRDLESHLEREKFTAWGRHKIANEVHKLGGKSFFNVRGKGINVLWVRNEFTRADPAALPASIKEHI